MPGWHTGNCFSCLPPPLCLASLVSVVCVLTPISSQIPRTIFGKSLLSLKKLMEKLHQQKNSFPKKFACHCADTFSALSIRRHSSEIVPARINWSDWGKKYVRAAADRTHVTCIHTFSGRVMKNTWAVCEGLFSKQFSDPRQGSAECSQWRRPLLLPPASNELGTQNWQTKEKAFLKTKTSVRGDG